MVEYEALHSNLRRDIEKISNWVRRILLLFKFKYKNFYNTYIINIL